MTDPRVVKRELARLAGAADADAALVELASDAVTDVERAATVVEDVGYERLAAAVAAVDDPALTRRGQRALAALERYRRVAAGGGSSPAREPRGGAAGDHFHSGRGTDLSRGRQGTGR